MERRWGARRCIEVDVVIDNQPESLLRGKIGNVSIGGLFVRTEPAGLAMNAQLELVLMLQQENGTHVYRMPAVVVRVAPDGAGLRFDQYDVGTFRTLVMLLLAWKRGALGGASGPAFQSRSRPGPAVPHSARAASALEGTTGRIASANAPAAPVTTTSPVHGESH